MEKAIEQWFEQADEFLRDLKYKDEYRSLFDDIEKVRNDISDLDSLLKGKESELESRQKLIDDLDEDTKISPKDLFEKICDIHDVNCNIHDHYVCLEFWASNNKDCIYEMDYDEDNFIDFVKELLDCDFESRKDDDIELYAREHNHIQGCPDLDSIIEDCEEECRTWKSLQDDVRYFFEKDTRFINFDEVDKDEYEDRE